MDAIEQAVRNTQAYYCLECGKCTSVCPVARRNGAFSPRLMVEKCIKGQGQELLADRLMWACLTCRRCSEICPSDVHYSEFTRDLRIEARHLNQEGHCSHGQAIQTLMRLMTAPELKQNRLDWLDQDLRTSTASDTLYFVGCVPYYQVLFHKLGAQGVDIARSVVRVLNRLGIEPVVLPNERCCGHDLLWEGDVENFRRLAEENAAMIRETGAKRIVTACPEGYHTLSVDYPRYVGKLDVEVIHISELVADRIDDLKLRPLEGKVTYQDPCRLGRYMGVYDAPRKIIEALGLELVEMEYSGPKALCCGTSAWTNCGQVSKDIQVERLRQARATEAELLVTACAKCQIHFRCAMDDINRRDEISMEVRDLVTLVAEALD